VLHCVNFTAGQVGIPTAVPESQSRPVGRERSPEPAAKLTLDRYCAIEKTVVLKQPRLQGFNK